MSENRDTKELESEIVEIQATLNYDKFKSILGNRKIYEPHVSELAETIAVRDLLVYFPVLVNENFEIIDGQHRFEVCQRLGKPVYYIVAPGLTLDDVININTKSKRWALDDYVNSYITQGLKDYETLKSYHERTGFSYTISAMLLSGIGGTNTSGGNSAAQTIKRGSFRVDTRTKAEDMAIYLNELQPYSELDLPKERDFVAAMLKLVMSTNFDVKRLIDKLETHKLKIEKQPTPRHYMLEIERIYNFRAYDRVDIFTGRELDKTAK